MIFTFNKSSTMHAYLGSTVEQSVKYKRNKHTLRCTYTLVVCKLKKCYRQVLREDIKRKKGVIKLI